MTTADELREQAAFLRRKDVTWVRRSPLGAGEACAVARIEVRLTHQLSTEANFALRATPPRGVDIMEGVVYINDNGPGMTRRKVIAWLERAAKYAEARG